MAGIYIHIPFCKKICSYCDFYKTAVVDLLPDYLEALETEIEIQKDYLAAESVETIYFGGGTPSLLEPEQINRIINRIRRFHPIASDCEITLEANPDDLSETYLADLYQYAPINRISVGIQSFEDKDLLVLNRRHNARQAIESIRHLQKTGYYNISVDLIYGLPGMNTESWQKNLDLVISMGVQHLSAYHLSIEPGTALSRLASRGLLQLADEEESCRQFALLRKTAAGNAFVHYEISNLAKEGYFSKHNTNYWMQKKYLGLGASAHSYNIFSRQWNIANARKYIAAMNHGGDFFEKEDLQLVKRYNEYLMVSLRTIQGVDLEKIRLDYGERSCKAFVHAAQSSITAGFMTAEGSVYRLTENGWLISDHIISGLMEDADGR